MGNVRSVVVAGVVAGVVAWGGGVARADVLQDLGATFQPVAQELAAAFPKVEARVAAVDGAEVRIEGAGVGGLRPGLELTVYRKGGVFRHPVTGQPLGHLEEEVAVVAVTAASGGQATARVVAAEAGRVPVAGDGARLSAGRLPVAVLPPVGVTAAFESADQTALLLVARFSALLERTGRFLPLEPRRVLEVAGAGGPPASTSALEMARRLGVPAVLTSRVVQDGPVRSLEVAWISGRTGAAMVTTRTALVRAVFPPRFVWEQTPELDRRLPLDGSVRGLAVADLDGDGRPELVVADERTLTIYRWEDKGGGLRPVPGGEVRTSGLVLSVDAADVNGTGRAQIVVVDYRGEGIGLRAAVLELTGTGLRTIHESRGSHLRIVQVGAEPWLLEQPAGQSEPFEPTIRRLRWQDGRYQPGSGLRLPNGISVYGLALMRLTGSADPEIVAITPDDRLAVWTARGQRLWTSGDPYGGSAITFPFTPALPARDRRDEVIGRVAGRVIALADPSQGPEVLVFENLLPLGGQARTFLPRLASTLFSQGRVHRLRWKDGGFFRVWQSGITEGYVADFGYGDLNGDGVPEVVVGVVPRGLSLETLNPLARPKASLVLYELP